MTEASLWPAWRFKGTGPSRRLRTGRDAQMDGQVPKGFTWAMTRVLTTEAQRAKDFSSWRGASLSKKARERDGCELNLEKWMDRLLHIDKLPPVCAGAALGASVWR